MYYVLCVIQVYFYCTKIRSAQDHVDHNGLSCPASIKEKDGKTPGCQVHTPHDGATQERQESVSGSIPDRCDPEMRGDALGGVLCYHVPECLQNSRTAGDLLFLD